VPCPTTTPNACDLCEQASQSQDRERMRQLTKEILLLLRESMKKELKSLRAEIPLTKSDHGCCATLPPLRGTQWRTCLGL